MITIDQTVEQTPNEFTVKGGQKSAYYLIKKHQNRIQKKMIYQKEYKLIGLGNIFLCSHDAFNILMMPAIQQNNKKNKNKNNNKFKTKQYIKFISYCIQTLIIKHPTVTKQIIFQTIYSTKQLQKQYLMVFEEIWFRRYQTITTIVKQISQKKELKDYNYSQIVAKYYNANQQKRDEFAKSLKIHFQNTLFRSYKCMLVEKKKERLNKLSNLKQWETKVYKQQQNISLMEKKKSEIDLDFEEVTLEQKIEQINKSNELILQKDQINIEKQKQFCSNILEILQKIKQEMNQLYPKLNNQNIIFNQLKIKYSVCKQPLIQLALGLQNKPYSYQQILVFNEIRQFNPYLSLDLIDNAESTTEQGLIWQLMLVSYYWKHGRNYLLSGTNQQIQGIIRNTINQIKDKKYHFVYQCFNLSQNYQIKQFSFTFQCIKKLIDYKNGLSPSTMFIESLWKFMSAVHFLLLKRAKYLYNSPYKALIMYLYAQSCILNIYLHKNNEQQFAKIQQTITMHRMKQDLSRINKKLQEYKQHTKYKQELINNIQNANLIQQIDKMNRINNYIFDNKFDKRQKINEMLEKIYFEYQRLNKQILHQQKKQENKIEILYQIKINKILLEISKKLSQRTLSIFQRLFKILNSYISNTIYNAKNIEQIQCIVSWWQNTNDRKKQSKVCQTDINQIINQIDLPFNDKKSQENTKPNLM